LLENVETEHVNADKGYDSEKGYYGRSRSLERLPSSHRGPTGRCRKGVRPRSLQEAQSDRRTFNKLKRLGCLGTRYDRKAIYFGSFLYLAASLLWL
jgi:hypothetical protein